MSRQPSGRTSTRPSARISRRPPVLRSARTCLPFEKTLEVRDGCLCLFVQRAARALGRLFDRAFRPVGLTHGQFSLLMALNRPDPPAMGEVAALLGMDR